MPRALGWIALLLLAFALPHPGPAALEVPSYHQSEVIFVGRVRSAGVEGPDELLRAEVDIECLVRTSVPLKVFATVYYRKPGVGYAPRVVPGQRALFFCQVQKTGSDQRILMVPDMAHLIPAQPELTLPTSPKND